LFRRRKPIPKLHCPEVAEDFIFPQAKPVADAL
jgi:hypothetical protein